MIASRTTVNISYCSFNARQATEFILFPYLLKEYNNRWFLFGSRAGDMKLFNLALDRIEDFHPCPEIPFKENPDFGDDYFDDIVGVTKHDRLEKTTVRFIADNRHASYILTKPIHSSQKLISKNKEDGSMLFELTDIIINPELTRAILSFGDGVEVLTPMSLVKLICRIFREGLKKYDPSSSPHF